MPDQTAYAVTATIPLSVLPTAVLKKVRYALCPMPYALCPIVPHMRARKAVNFQCTVVLDNQSYFLFYYLLFPQ
jgi:hypothetical protein